MKLFHAKGLYSPVNCSSRSGNLLIQNAALKFVVLSRRRGAFVVLLLTQCSTLCSFRGFFKLF